MRREAGGEQQLEAERELVGVRGVGARGVEQRELVAEQVEDARVRLGRVEQAHHRVARPGRAVERARVGAQAGVRRSPSRRSSP